METEQIVALILEILTFVGGSSILAAVVPAKWVNLIPGLRSIIDILAANFLNAKNDPQIKEQ